MDVIKRAILFKNTAIVDILDTKELIQQAIDYHKLSDEAAVALGKVLMIGAFISSGFKDKGEKLTIIVQGEGTGKKIVVCGNSIAQVRGYIENTQANGSVVNIVGKKGYLNVIKDFGMKEPYNGISQIVAGNIDFDFAYYFTYSEQLPTAISLSVKVENGKCIAANGIIVQPMPNCDEGDIFILQDIVSQFKDFSKIVEEKGGVQETLDFYFGHFDINQLEDINPIYKCNCSDERTKELIRSLGKKEAEDIVNEVGKIEVGCQFCNKKYVYRSCDLRSIFDE